LGVWFEHSTPGEFFGQDLVVELTCRVSSDHSILEGGPLVHVVPDHLAVRLRGHVAQA
jgi:hypothetical protein